MLKNNLQNTLSYPVMEHFYTIQGEGYHQGKAAYFIRLGGCDVGCVWCDVKESWDAGAHPHMLAPEIAEIAASFPGKIAVITGGEPLNHNCDELTKTLKQKGLQTHIETSGSSALTGQWNWICLSPKKFKPPTDEILPLADELKIVVYNQSDFAWAEKYAQKVSPSCKLFLQPEWSKSAQITPLIIEYIKNHPQWEFSLQMHKYIHVP